jgi:hypothetical protein
MRTPVKSRLNAGSLGVGGCHKTSHVPSPRPNEGGCVGDDRAHSRTGILFHTRVLSRAAFEIVGSHRKRQLGEERRPTIVSIWSL